jgi:Beta-xylosidase
MRTRFMLRRTRPAIVAIACLVATCARFGAAGRSGANDTPAYLFSYFTRNGEDGVHLAYSRDGISWSALNGGRAVITPAITGAGRGWQEWNTTAALMRDPSILRGPDGVFHLVWTVAWTDHGIGVAHSRDLIHWSTQTRVPVMEHEPDALNAWAPDLFYD